MKRPVLARTLLVLALALAASGCSEQIGQAAEEARQSIAAATAEGSAALAAIDEARKKLHEGNLRIGAGGPGPVAEISPQGDLLIDGVPLPLSEAQRAAVQAYRTQLLAVTDAGMAIGQDGIALAGQAVTAAVAGVLGGTVAEAGARIEAEAQKMQAAGLALCDEMQGLALAQDQLALLLPEFRPYAQAIELDAHCPPAQAAATPATPPVPPTPPATP